MHDNLIDRSANRRRELWPVRIGKSFESRLCAMVTNECLSKAIQLARRTTRSYMLCQLCQRSADQEVSITHQLYFVVCFKVAIQRKENSYLFAIAAWTGFKNCYKISLRSHFLTVSNQHLFTILIIPIIHIGIYNISFIPSHPSIRIA